MRQAFLLVTVAAVAALGMVADGAAKPVAFDRTADFTYDWSGTWQTTYGVMSLKQSGTAVTGTFGTGGTIKGTTNTTGLSGTYAFAGRSGSFRFQYSSVIAGYTSPDDFIGRYSGGSPESTSSPIPSTLWSGHRNRPTPAVGAKIPFSFSGGCGSPACSNQLYSQVQISGSGTITITKPAPGGGTGTAQGTLTISLTGGPSAPGGPSNYTGSGTFAFDTTVAYSVFTTGEKFLLLATGSTGGGGTCAGAGAGANVETYTSGARIFVTGCRNSFSFGVGAQDQTVSAQIGDFKPGTTTTTTTSTSTPTTTTSPSSSGPQNGHRYTFKLSGNASKVSKGEIDTPTAKYRLTGITASLTAALTENGAAPRNPRGTLDITFHMTKLSGSGLQNAAIVFTYRIASARKTGAGFSYSFGLEMVGPKQHGCETATLTAAPNGITIRTCLGPATIPGTVVFRDHGASG